MIFAQHPDDLSGLVGSTGIGERFSITQDRIDAFADLTEDRQWIHVDPVRASPDPFGSTIAHGLLTLSLVPHLIHDLVEVRNVDSVVNYGIDHHRNRGRRHPHPLSRSDSPFVPDHVQFHLQRRKERS